MIRSRNAARARDLFILLALPAARYAIIVDMVKRAQPRRAGVALTIVLMAGSYAFGLNPSLDVNQYAHNSWTIRDGFFKAEIRTIAQTQDGYLWLGTDSGISRFDGARTSEWTPPSGDHLPSETVLKLLVTRDGRLWIGTANGLASWKDGRLTGYPQLAGQSVIALLEDHEGTVWAGSAAVPAGNLCTIHANRVQCFGAEGSLGRGVISLYEFRGSVWAAGATGLWRRTPDPPRLFPIREPVTEVRALIEGDGGELWIATQRGISVFVNDRIKPLHLLMRSDLHPYRLLRDREGGLWIGTFGHGLIHLHQGEVDTFTESDGLSSETVDDLFEDREGNIWVATTEGLDRFREFAIPTFSVKQGLSGRPMTALAAKDGSVWFSTSEGLDRFKGGQVTIYRKHRGSSKSVAVNGPSIHEIADSGLPDDSIESIFEDDTGRIWASTTGGVAYFEDGRFVKVDRLPARVVLSFAQDSSDSTWVDEQNLGLFRLVDGRVVEHHSASAVGGNDILTALAPDPADGGLWLGFFHGGVSYLKAGQIQASFGTANGLGKGRVSGIHRDHEGRFWIATEGGLSLMKNGQIKTLATRNGLPCDAVHWAAEDEDHALWMSTACGMMRILRPEVDAWIAHPDSAVKITVFDSSDGTRTQAPTGYAPSVSKAPDGKIWFVSRGGVSVIDPRHLKINTLPPPLRIEQILADGNRFAPTSNIRLPPLVRDVRIDYTALSFAAPEKVRFRYKLEGQDGDWTEVVNQRQVHYSNLRPGRYHFRVIAANNSGVWNETGETIDFSVAPAYYQATWFRVSAVAAFFMVLLGLYQLRLYQLAQEYKARLDERVRERTRMARDLHDTLLQSLSGLMLRLEVVKNRLPAGRTKDEFEEVLERGDHAIAEGRNAVYDLRWSASVTNELAQALRIVGEELATEDSAALRIVVEGEPRELQPMVRDEIYRIAREGLRNAFTHAGARNIETEILYGSRQFRLRIRDDGRGTPFEFLKKGRPGHYGLSGMRERAETMGTTLNIWSTMGAGTEIDLEIPGSIAYGTSNRLFMGIFRGRGKAKRATRGRASDQ
jgi:signal transduction histidine kinase/ligand-binding sensor domain-containing protein